MKRKHFQVFWYQTWRSIFIHQRARARTHTHTHAAYAVTRWARERECVCVRERERERERETFWFFLFSVHPARTPTINIFTQLSNKRQKAGYPLSFGPLGTHSYAHGRSCRTRRVSRGDLFSVQKRPILRKKESFIRKKTPIPTRMTDAAAPGSSDPLLLDAICFFWWYVL